MTRTKAAVIFLPWLLNLIGIVYIIVILFRSGYYFAGVIGIMCFIISAIFNIFIGIILYDKVRAFEEEEKYY